MSFYFLLLFTENVQTENEKSKLFISTPLLKQRKKNVMLALVAGHTGYALRTTTRSTGFDLMCSKPAQIKEEKMDACRKRMLAQLAWSASGPET